MFQATAPLIRLTGEPPRDGLGAAAPFAPNPDDLRLAERVGRALRATGYGPLRDVEVTARARLVVLRGRVPSYYMKQVAQTIALAVAGAQDVRNHLDVGRPG